MNRTLAIAAALALGGPALAQPIEIDDASFENSNLNPCQFRTGFLNSAWVHTGGCGPWYSDPPNCWDMVPPDGKLVAYSNGGSISQTLAAEAQAGEIYTLGAFLGRRTSCCGFSPTTLEVFAGSLLLGSRTVELVQQPPPGQWSRYWVTVTAPADLPAGMPLVIRFSTPGAQTDIDVVTLVQGDCHADFNDDFALNIFDFLAFQTAFSNGDPSADIAAPIGVLNIFDFLAFQTAFGLGC